LTTTGSGAVNLVNPNTPTPTITLTNAQVVSSTVAPPQTVVTGVTAPTANNFLTLTRACLQLGELCARTDQNQTQNTWPAGNVGIPKSAIV
jgi:hypothetical protein